MQSNKKYMLSMAVISENRSMGILKFSLEFERLQNLRWHCLRHRASCSAWTLLKKYLSYIFVFFVLGMKFGLLQTKVGLVFALSKYEFHICKETVTPLIFDPKSFILCPVGGTKLQIRNRMKRRGGKCWNTRNINRTRSSSIQFPVDVSCGAI
jgi:hypothetical protein